MIKSYKNTRMIVILSFLLFSLNIFGIQFIENVRVKNEVVTLKDLVFTTDEKLLNDFAEIELGSINIPGGKIIVRKKDIEPYLLPYNLPNLNIPTKIIVERVYQSVERDTIIRVIEDELRKLYEDTDYDYNIELFTGNNIRMPIGNLSYKVEAGNFQKELGRKSMSLSVYEGGKRVYAIPFKADIGKTVREYILKKDVEPGDVFDFSMVEVKEEFVYEKVKLHNVDAKEGYIFTRKLLAGNVLEEGALERNTLIKKGDKVTIYVKYGNMYITDIGTALEGGEVGDEVEVENARTGKKVRGIIKDDKSIETIVK